MLWRNKPIASAPYPHTLSPTFAVLSLARTLSNYAIGPCTFVKHVPIWMTENTYAGLYQPVLGRMYLSLGLRLPTKTASAC